MSLAIVILAAGKGTRMKSRRPKVLHEIGGKPLLAHVIAAAGQVVAPRDIFVVVGHEAEQVKAAVGPMGVQFVLQEEALGTGHAIQSAREAIAGYDDVLVLPGDVPLIRAETLKMLMEYHGLGSAMTILTARPENPFGYARVIRRERENALEVEAVVEQRFLEPEQLAVSEISTGIYAFRTKPLVAHSKWLILNDETGEYPLADLARIFVREGEVVTAVETSAWAEVLDANRIPELMKLDARLRAEAAERLMLSGVTIFRPESCVIDSEVEVGADTVIEPNVQLLGKTVIGCGCLIRSGTVIENSTLADGVVIRQSCVVTDSKVMTGATIGPFAHLRPGSEIGEEAHVGNFVETKMARLGRGVKAGHLSYLGDADIGAGTNIGAGVITCNYDGVHKHRTKIGKGAFIGSDSTLVAPVTIEDGAYIGAGSCITKEVPAGALAVARSRQVTKEGWVEARRKGQQGEC